MSRPLSAFQMKTNVSRRQSDKPKAGTKLRKMYDMLITGNIVHLSEMGFSGKKVSRWGSYKVQLRDFYGLEFRHSKPKAGVQVVGIWDGPYLVPIERLDHDNIEPSAGGGVEQA